MPKPRVLYKYRGRDRINDMRSLTIRFTPPGRFNDPFEALVAVEGAFAPASVEELVRLTHEAAQEDGVVLDEEEIRAELKAGNEQSGSVAPRIISDLTNETFGVLSLSEPDDDILMWSHYGESHAGFLIGFDAHHDWFDQREYPDDVINHLRPVEYSGARPRIYLSDARLSPGADSARVAAEIFLRKSNHWRYEKEWRMVRPLKAADQVVSAEIHLFRFPPDAVVEVVVGWRMDFGGLAAIREALDDPRMSHVRLRRATLHDSDYALQVNDC